MAVSRLWMAAVVMCASSAVGAQDARVASRDCVPSTERDVYQFSEKRLDSDEVVDLSQFRGKVC